MKRRPLKGGKGIKPFSDKQKIRLAEWKKVKDDRIAYLTEKYGFHICEYCGKKGLLDDSLWGLDGHHIDRRRSNNTAENCYICHRICHIDVTDNNILVNQEDFSRRGDYE